VLAWQVVPGVGWYLLGGPGMGPNGQQVQGSSYTFDSPGPGQHQWTVASLAGQGQGPVNNWVNWPKASLSIESLTGNYRVMVVGIRAPHATADDWWSRDGKWDEVYVSAFVQTFDRTSAQLLNSRTVQSPIHGDINGFPAGSRVRAGSASDLGGIVNGDQVSPVLGQPAPGASGYPLLTLWQGPMTTSREVVVVHPVLWEADVGDNNTMAYNGWKQFFEGTPSRGWGSGLTNPDPQAPSWFQEGPVVRLSGAVDRMCLLERNDKDRPIGLEKYDGATAVGVCGIWLDHMLVLTRERIERALNDPYATGEKGLLELRLNDYYQIPNGPRLSDTNMQGDYVLVLRVERTS
ncbi:MAG: hypothetical protein ACJ8BF_12560, partial [Gemmatimonadales bacterium]